MVEKVIHSKEFIERNEKATALLIQEAEEYFLTTDLQILNWKETEIRWSVLECLMHLNSYAEYYFAEFEKAIKHASGSQPVTSFKTSWFGRKCVKSVHPDTRISKKMNAPKIHNHNSASQHSIEVVKDFIEYQKRLLRILHAAKGIDITKPKVKVQIAKMLRLNLGEFMNFMLTHQRRHMDQALEILTDAKKRTS